MCFRALSETNLQPGCMSAAVGGTAKNPDVCARHPGIPAAAGMLVGAGGISNAKSRKTASGPICGRLSKLSASQASRAALLLPGTTSLDC